MPHRRSQGDRIIGSDPIKMVQKALAKHVATMTLPKSMRF